ncbi:MAG: cellobiose phosphorylase [Candidatus Omnitrophica bacterium]|nr:cellobiose phosphorylase [Candidatus Omnitrophota bacterium]
MSHPLYTYLDDAMTFTSASAARCRTLYFPLCGPTENQLKCAVSPYLAGDIKLDKSAYVTPPVSREDLRRPLRNVFVSVDGAVCALADPYGDASLLTVTAGQLWHQVTRIFPEAGISVSVVNFCPAGDDCVELMRVNVRNDSDTAKTVTPTVAVPLFARALENKHDHEHVTSLLNRIEQVAEGVLVNPTMKFDETGHLPNERVYFVYGVDGKGAPVDGSFPTISAFCGEQGDFHRPAAIYAAREPVALPEGERHGQEAVGALRFARISLPPGQTGSYLVAVGIASDYDNSVEIFNRYKTPQLIDQALADNKTYWAAKTASITVHSGDADYDAWMRWVVLQPVLRRIFGCSFLPDHDYGKGGKGWRDIWQDLLSLILIEPEQVRDNLINNFGGVRIDGSNATIIGARPGEFIADRNKISRVWMDHGVWPLLTLSLYIDQTGDYDILLEQQPYFRDHQRARNMRRDGADYSGSGEEAAFEGNRLRDHEGTEYRGTLIEHLLVQALVQFYNVGEHNIIRLENADWNDGLDMAFERGESVAFASQYGGNLLRLATLLDELAERKGLEDISVARELLLLLDNVSDPVDYDDIEAKQAVLLKHYFPAVEPCVSGKKENVTVKDVVKNLRHKGQWIFDHIRQQEKISVDGHTWFNGYYDNQGQRVEGKVGGVTRMTLTGQVFPVMSGLAKENDIVKIIAAVDKHLRDTALGGYRLNTDFQRPHYLDLGRAFGFAYGTKENGAFFSHMIVMYAYALYRQGFARAGHAVLDSIFRMCQDTDKSLIYPGVPEYLDSLGRGMYHYLTGSASWLVLTVLTQVYGVAGEGGRLRLRPQLVKAQFDGDGCAIVRCMFAGKRICVTYSNPQHLEFGDYQVTGAAVNGTKVAGAGLPAPAVCIERSVIAKAVADVQINVSLGPRG